MSTQIKSPDVLGLLAALVLAPQVYSRNRFFSLYERTDCRQARTRAAQLRSILRDLCRQKSPFVKHLSAKEVGEGEIEFVYHLPELRLKRVLRMGQFEWRLLHVALAARWGVAAPPSWAREVDSALLRLMHAAA